jgi:colanic acid/amylovoran biosynthesis glycosyltransferase
MKLVIFDGSFNTTAFINRLIQGLVKHGVEVFVLGFNEELKEKIKDVNYVSLGSSQRSIKFALTSLSWGLKSKSILTSVRLLLNGEKSKLKQLNLNAAPNHIQPDLIHLQWVSNISLFEEHLNKKQFKFILSQRGYQTNVRPFVNTQNFAYLQKWLPKFDGFHSVSKAISKVGDQIYTDPKKIDQVVYTGLDISKFNFQTEVVKNKRLQIISVGRPHWKKGYDHALKACALLDQQGVDFKYTIVGAAGDEELLFLIDDLDLQHKITLTDKLPQAEVFELMQSSDLFLLPSLEEGIANVAVEAMALGCPVISSDCGGMKELIAHRKEGWIVPVRNSFSMSEQILNFVQSNKDELESITLAARKKVEGKHSENKMIENMMNVYRRIL